METTVQRRFRVQPCSESVALPFIDKIACDTLIRRTVDSESQTNTVLIKRTREEAKMADEKNRKCQYDVNYRGK